MTVKLDSLELKMIDIRASSERIIVSNKDTLRDYKKTLDLKIEENKVRMNALQDRLSDLCIKYEDLMKTQEDPTANKSKVSLGNNRKNSLGDSSTDTVQVSSSSEEEDNETTTKMIISRDDLKEIKNRLSELEMINPMSGFFAWTVRDFEKFRRCDGEATVRRDKFKTSCFGFECRMVLLWNNPDLRRRVNLSFEVVGLTPMTVPFLPFFCDVVISVVSGDGGGEIMTREISCTEFTEATSEQDWNCICRAVIEDFLVLPDHDVFVSDNALKMFGYFKPFDPSVELVSEE